MATAVSDQRANYQPVLSTTANYLGFENDQANIRAGRRTQQAITSRQRWQSYLSPNAYKRSRLSPEDDLRQAGETTDVNLGLPVGKGRHSFPVRVARRLASKHGGDQYDPDTIPIRTKREQRRFEKREKRQYEKFEKRKLDKQDAQRRQQHDQISPQQHDQISRLLEVSQREKQSNQPSTLLRRSVRDKVKVTLKKSTKIGKTKSQSIPSAAQAPSAPLYVPHIDEFESKSQFQSWFGPSDVEALPPPPPPVETIPDFPCAAELPAVSISPPYDFRSDVGRRHSDDGNDLDTLPPRPIRSPSPCLSSIPRRIITISETPQALSNKQMQCDYCHDAIKLTGFYYTCVRCDDGDCLYCAKCANDGRTCRHELIERTRDIKRHPTNPHYQDRKGLSLEKDVGIPTDVHAELSASSPPTGTASQQTSPQTSDVNKSPSQKTEPAPEHFSVPVSSSPTEVFREFEAKRREQEIAFREKEVTLREREAMLREREAWTASRERDAALVQQLHAAAMLQRERSTEVGAQFMSVPSRHSSCSSHFARVQTDESECGPSRSFSNAATHHTKSPLGSCAIRHHPSYSPRTEQIKLHSSGGGKRPNVELVSAVAALEASVAGIDLAEPALRSHANSSKRKAPPADGRSSGKGTSKRGQSNSRRGPPKKNFLEDQGDNDESDGSEKGSSKRQKQEPTDEQDNTLFACPFFKYDPLRYAEGNKQELHYRGCAGGLFRDISRVKQHLKRVHHRPDFYCRRCWVQFESSEKLQRHSSRAEGCDAEECPYPEKLDETQQNKIHVKRPGREAVQLWYDIFRIIFPNATLPESPYIESVEHKSSEQNILEQFIRLFEAKLDTSVSSQPWLSTSARDFIRAQMRQTLQETMGQTSSNPSRVPSLHVSPVSPGKERRSLDSRQGSHSSPASSSTHSAECEALDCRPLMSPISPATSSLRPALKVATQGVQGRSPSSGGSLHSATSQFPRIPPHVQEDVAGNLASSSWQSGDDMHVMRGPVQEPVSATSTRSGKSVTFATPPQFVASWRENHEPVVPWTSSFHSAMPPPDLSYFTNFDWSAENFATNGYCAHAGSSNKQQAQFVDSAYGTVSSRASRSSVFQPPASDRHQRDFHHTTCVDPQMLFVNPADANRNMPGISADLQAYLNRDSQACFGYQ